MSKKVKGLFLSRLVILIAIILVPLSIFLIYNLVDFKLWYSADPILEFWILQIISPLVFSISWLFFLILFSTRLANSLDSLDERVSVVPSRMKFFYGANAAYLLFIFVFPLATPVVSIVIFASFAWRITTYKKEDWNENPKAPKGTKIAMVLVSLVPIFCTVSILPEYFKLMTFLWEGIWIPVLPYLFMFSYSLFTAIAIGSLVIFINNEGISEYEQILEDSSQRKSYWPVKVLVVLLFIFFMFLDLNGFEVIQLFYWAGFIITIIIAVVNFIRGKSKYNNFKGKILGYIIAIIFIASTLLFDPDDIAGVSLAIISLLISAILFIIVFFYTFFTVK